SAGFLWPVQGEAGTVDDMSRARAIFDRPPVVETVLGVQFNPLKTSTTQLSQFWAKHLQADWPVVKETAPIFDQREHFNGVTWAPPVQISVTQVTSVPSR